MAVTIGGVGAHSDPEQRTWNSPEQIARHRAMSVAERIKLCVELSQAALLQRGPAARALT